MEVKCGRLAIIKEIETLECYGTISAEEFENPRCVATLHTEGDNQEGLPFAVVVTTTAENLVKIGLKAFNGLSIPTGTYYVDYVIMEATNASSLAVG